MKTSIITIGDEILIGQIVDTNSAFIAQKLGAIGCQIVEKLSIGDSEEQITSTINDALNRFDLVVITGGLGPTKDDITKTTLAKIFGSKMVNHPDIAHHVETMLAQRGIEYNALNQGQSMLPDNCTPLFNAHGTAPGMWFERNGKVVISLPGVPFEMERLIEDMVVPKLRTEFNLHENFHRTMITAGLAESLLAETIEEWESSLPDYIKLAYLPNFGKVRLRLSAYNIESSDVKSEIDDLFAQLERIIPQYVVGYESASIEEIVHQKMISRGLKLAVAESCTGGNIAAKFTAMAGASAYFMLGAVTYSNEAKESVLGVQHSTLISEGAVCESVAMQMAQGARLKAGADYAIATTGIAGPSGGSETKPVGTVWFGVATPKRCYAVCRDCGSERSQIIGRATAFAISLLNKEL